MQRRKGLLPALTTAILVTLGVTAAWCVSGNAWLSQAILQNGHAQVNVQVTKEGRAFVEHTYRNRTRRYTDFDNQDITLDGQIDYLPGARLIGHREVRNPRESRFWMNRVTAISDEQPTPTYWYFIHDGRRDGHGYFEGFDRETRRSTGFLGTDGFSAQQPDRSRQFSVNATRINTAGIEYSTISITRSASGQMPERSSTTSEWGRIPGWIVFIASGTRLYQVDLRTLSVTWDRFESEIVAVGKIDRVVSATAESDVALASRQELVVRTSDRLILYRPPNGQRREYLLPESPLSTQPFQVFALPNGNLLLSGSGYEKGDHYRVALELDSSGTVIHEHRNLRYRETVWEERKAAIAAAAAFPIPLYTAFWTAISRPAYQLRYHRELDYYGALAKTLDGSWPVMILLAALSLVSGYCILRRQRKQAAPHTTAWVIFGLLFGLPGWLGYWAHRSWPAQAECHECGRTVPRDRLECAQCAAAFPAPAALGTEVFA